MKRLTYLACSAYQRLRLAAAAVGLLTVCPVMAQTPELLHRFSNNSAVGASPTGKLFFDSDGTMYGTCNSNGNGNGTVWKRTTAGVISQVAAFTSNTNSGGKNPVAGLLKAGDGNFYGPTSNVATVSLQGAIYRLTPAGVLSGVIDIPLGGQFNTTPSNPWHQTVAGPGGVIYGSTGRGGTGWGTVWRIAADGSYSSIVEMTGTNPPDGPRPGSDPRGLAVTADGTLYFMARKWVYRRTIDGTLTLLLTLNETTQGDDIAAMVAAADGHLYGIIRASSVPAYRFFRLTTAGVFTVLQTLPSGDIAGRGQLIEASDGFFYTTGGGTGSTSNPSVPVRLGRTGGYKVYPKLEPTSGNMGGLVEGPGGYIYGTLEDDNPADPLGEAGGALFRFEIADAIPTITSALTATAQTASSFSYDVTGSDAPDSFTAVGLPAGLTFDTTTGRISGTVTAGTGVYNVTLTATNALGTSPAATLVLTVTNPGDALLAGLDVTGMNFSTTSFDTPPRLWFTQTAVSHDGTDAVQSGGPLNAFARSTMETTITGPATVSFWWKTDCPATSRMNFGGGFSFFVEKTGLDSPWEKVVANLGSGSHRLQWNFDRGSAAGGQNAGWVDELIIEAPNSAPVFVSPTTASGSFSQPFNFQVTATDVPTSYSATGLPPGLTFNTSSGLISGRPTAAGSHTVSLSATNSFGTTTSAFTLAINLVAGALDSEFNPNLGNTSGNAADISVMPNGQLIVAGSFTTVGGVAQPGLARLRADGTLDPSFNPSLTSSNSAWDTELLPDGKIIVAGSFTSIGGGARSRIAKLNADGTLDPSLPDLNPTETFGAASVNAVRLQQDGKLLLAGNFLTIGGVARNMIARFNSDSTMDALNPGVAYPGFEIHRSVHRINLQGDGKIFFSGRFSNIAGINRPHVARLTSAGVDDGFASQIMANGKGGDVVINPDGSVLVARDEYGIGGGLKLSRYLPNGVLDPNFSVALSISATVGTPVGVTSIATQCDGKIIIGGDFTSINGVTATRIARLHPNGTIDTTFSASANTTRPFSSDVPGTVSRVAIQADGRVVVAGNFLDINNQQRNRIARLLNDPATQSLSATASRIEWLRGGASPEADWVSFEQSTDTGVSWTHLGFGTRISGGWELTGLSVPAGAQVRGLARTKFGLIDSRLAGPAPEIAVEQPVGTGILDGAATITYPLDYVGATSAPQTALVRNRGSAPLTITGVNITGTHPGDYAVSPMSLPVTVVPEGAVEVSVTFTPTAEGTRTATLQIVSTDADESPFDINLTGSAKLPPNSAPDITSPLTATASVPNFFNYQITATDEPSSYAVTGLPPGFSYSSFSGAISGTPQGSGVFNVQISATNAGFGTGPAATLVITITNPGDVLREALDYPAGNFQAPGAAPWFSQTAISHDGVDAARSGVIGNFGQVSFSAAVTGPAIASWWWRTDCEATNDFLRATLSFVEKGRISGVAGAWTRVEIPIPNGSHTLQFIYQKNGSINSGADAVWVDEFSLADPTAPPVVTNTAISTNAGFFINQTFTTSQPFATMTATGLPASLTLDSSTGVLSGTAPALGTYIIPVTATNQAGTVTTNVTLTVVNPFLALLNAIEQPATVVPSVSGTWTAQTTVTHDGVDAITASPNWFDFARLTFNVQGPATFSCWWKANSGDFLNTAWIRLDGFSATIASISAQDSAWQRVEYAIPAGSHTVDVTMDRFSNTFSAAATIWLDEVSFVFPAASEIALEQPVGTDLTDGTATIAFGTVNTGSSGAAKILTVKNTGTSPLNVTGIATTGGNAAEFAISAPALPLSVAAAGSATFTVTFSPTAAGARSTTLQLLSNDADEATFDITLTGTGNVPVDGDTDGLPDAWETLHFGVGGSLPTNDDDNDGLNNLLEYAFGLNPLSGDLSGLPQPTVISGEVTLTLTKQPHVTYTVEASTDLTPGGFSSEGLTIVTDNATTLTVKETASVQRRQFRVRVAPAN